jgi:hypothetical protein
MVASSQSQKSEVNSEVSQEGETHELAVNAKVSSNHQSELEAAQALDL